jgi:hypothetical protein
MYERIPYAHNILLQLSRTNMTCAMRVRGSECEQAGVCGASHGTLREHASRKRGCSVIMAHGGGMGVEYIGRVDGSQDGMKEGEGGV